MQENLATQSIPARSEQAAIVSGPHSPYHCRAPLWAAALAAVSRKWAQVAVERLLLAHCLWPALISMRGDGVRTAATLLTSVAHKVFSRPST